MKITCLLENTSTRENLIPEHGLSLLIQTESHRILFDMGQTSRFAENAKLLGEDLSTVDLAILSHGHYDHGGGLPTFLTLNSNAPIYINRHAFGDYYNGDGKYIGLDHSLKNHARVILTDDLLQIDDTLTLRSCNSLPRPNFPGCFGLTQKIADEFIDDAFLHEQYLLIEEKGKRVLISGCSHKGILDITQWFAPDVLIGGFHFSKMPTDHKLTEIAKKLGKEKTTYYTCHCTGTAQYDFMKADLRNLHYLSCGDSINI